MSDFNTMVQNSAVLDPKVEAQVDELSKPGNEDALNKALNDEFKQTEDPAKNDPQPTDDPAPEADPDPSDPDPAPEADKGDDPLKDQDPDKDPKPASKEDRSKRLLADRNQARDEAAKAQLDKAADTKKISDLEAENARLRSGDKGEGDGDDPTPSADDKPMTKAEMDKYFADKEAKANQEATAEKSDTTEVEALRTNKETPNSQEFETEIKGVMKKHPTISAYAAYRMLQGEGIISSDNAQLNSNANKLNTGDRPKNNLVKEVNTKNMTAAEQEAYLLKEQAAGRMEGIL